MYYLRRLNVVLGSAGYEDGFGALRRELLGDGIEMEVRTLGGMEAGELSAFWETEDARREGVLWMTDHAGLARRLAEKGCPVMAFLHGDNAEQDFGAVRYACEEPGEVETAYLEGVYRRCRVLPLDILSTGRLSLRETTEADVDAFYRIYQHPSITRYMEDLYPDREQERAYIREYIEQVYGFYDFGVWTVEERRTGQVIGRAGFSFREGFEDPEIGFIIGVPWQRQGYAYEICSAILEYGWSQLGFTKVYALVQPDNLPSLALCRKLGMEYGGRVTDQGTEYCRMIKTVGKRL